MRTLPDTLRVCLNESIASATSTASGSVNANLARALRLASGYRDASFHVLQDGPDALQDAIPPDEAAIYVITDHEHDAYAGLKQRLRQGDTGLEGVLGCSITYRIAVGLYQGRKAFSLQTLPSAGSLEETSARVAKVAGFSLHAGVAAARHERQKLERLCRYDVQGSTSVAGGRKPE